MKNSFSLSDILIIKTLILYKIFKYDKKYLNDPIKVTSKIFTK